MRMVEYAQLEWWRGGRRTQWEPGEWEMALEIALRKGGREKCGVLSLEDPTPVIASDMMRRTV
jgi:hypothetical protein